jgi:hypothetical protein
MTPDIKLAVGFAIFYVFGLGVMLLLSYVLRDKGATE